MVSGEITKPRCQMPTKETCKTIWIVILGLTTVVFVTLFALAFVGVIGKFKDPFISKHFHAHGEPEGQSFGENCKMFRSDKEVNKDVNTPYVPTFLMYCAREAVWKFLQDNCKSLDACAHPREMDQWKYFDEVMQLHAAYRRLMIILQLLDRSDPKKMEYHIGGGTLLGFLRHDDIIPHDHDVDFYMTTDTKKFIIDNIDKLPKDVNLMKFDLCGADHYKLVDMNTCLPDLHNEGIQIDLFDSASLDAWNRSQKLNIKWDWEKDAKPISKVNVRGYDWPVPANVGKEITQYYKGQKALTYVPFKRDSQLIGANANRHCVDVDVSQFIRKAEIKNGLFAREQK